MRRTTRLAFVIVMIGIAACTRPPKPVRPVPPPVPTPTPVTHTVASVLAEIGPRVRARWQPFFEAAGLVYPPRELALLGFKGERRLEIWGRGAETDAWRRLDVYPILAASGGPGPKLQQGDRQVPEGIYAITALNPNSAYHLSMRVDYPNAFDVAVADDEGRENLGGDIFIHGHARSIGCLALGDRNIENLFVLVADVGVEHVYAVLAPRDPRGAIPLAPIAALPFTRELYRQITEALQPFPPLL